MSEEGGVPVTGRAPAETHHNGHDQADHRPAAIFTNLRQQLEDELPTTPAGRHTPNPFSRHHSTLDLDDYFTGPRDILKHSKWPVFMQMHGSILPKMILPLFFVGCWATFIFCMSHFRVFGVSLNVNTVLLTILGFVVSLGLSFRSSSAYERYGEGRRYWASLIQASQALGRVFWIHTTERPGEQGKKDLLAKLSAMNLLVSFAVALKHKLRYEPYTHHDDLSTLVAHLDTYAQAATRDEPDKVQRAMKRSGFFKSTGEYLGISWAASNPRKAVKRASNPIGNLPLEVLSYLAAYIDETITNGQMPIPMQQTLAYNNLAVLNDVLTGTERVLTTPLPIAYSIAISQITWVYILLLPFQLITALEWVTIPASITAAYIILGLLMIGREVENPFGQDVNDLPLESYCEQIAHELDIIASKKKPRSDEWIETLDNKVLWPLSVSGWNVWMHRGEESVRRAVGEKVRTAYQEQRKKEAIVNGDASSKGSSHGSAKKEGVKAEVSAV